MEEIAIDVPIWLAMRFIWNTQLEYRGSLKFPLDPLFCLEYSLIANLKAKVIFIAGIAKTTIHYCYFDDTPLSLV